MNLNWARTAKELDCVLLNPGTKGPDISYWVFSAISTKKWENMTVIAPGTYGNEYNKTYGHYHPHDTLETYKLIQGNGILLLQKKHMDNDKWVPNKVDEVLLIKFEPGEELLIPDQWGHAWSNVGDTPLISFDDWRYGHSPSDYNYVKDLRGMSYYITNTNAITFVPNPNYVDLPKPKVVTVNEAKIYLEV